MTNTINKQSSTGENGRGVGRHFAAYRAFHQQGFVPIFVDDHFDSKMLVEACVAAGCRGIEYTLRRRDAHVMIPWIRAHYPELYLLVGSTLDDDRIVARMKKRHPQLLTLAEIDAMNVDGFVSMIGWSEESIRRYAPNRIVVPSAWTVNDAFFQVKAGAHFAKLLGPEIELVKRCRMQAAFDYCPIMVTGGMTSERIPATIEAGAAMVGAGFDVILKGCPANTGVEQAAAAVRSYLDATREARAGCGNGWKTGVAAPATRCIRVAPASTAGCAPPCP